MGQQNMDRNGRGLLVVDPWGILFPKGFNALSEDEELKEAFSSGLQFVADLDISRCLDIFHDLIVDGFKIARDMKLYNSLNIFRTVVSNASPHTDSVTQTAMSIVINDRYWSLKTLDAIPNPALNKVIIEAHRLGFSLVFMSLHYYAPAFQHLLRTRLPNVSGYFAISDSPIGGTVNIDNFIAETAAGKNTDSKVKILITHSDSEILRRTGIEEFSSRFDIAIVADSSEEIMDSMRPFL
ncbi:hypothetical protein ApAK_03225 [Thermoplasmatales archaeon AK]|nr:hypothetical protein [Thermoplasmatales archaeon AK]